MSDLEVLMGRIDALETRVAYQDQTIETLNATIVEQWKRIDELVRQLALLDDRLRETEVRQPGVSPAEKPPHY
jgi:SlyX protein